MSNITRVSASNLLSFINGYSVEGYGDADAAKKVRPTLVSSMEYAVRATRMYHTERNQTFGSFLVMALEGLSYFAKKELNGISAVFKNDWERHYNSWCEDHVRPLETSPDGLGSIDDMNLPSLEDNDDVVNAALKRISLTLFEWYIHSLTRIASKEATLPGEQHLGPSYQDIVSIIPEAEWDTAWDAQFHGDVLRRLALKLHLNVHAVGNYDGKAGMSRIIPVVQASGTGKSRLAEE